ncbi:hypothetical protein CTheo_8841 [Ceratobasidium theobromae]|uniref:Uncharacterized protein n=1 Tax=Ceratobasidium theobromae TaxID=1582974 RepID=A0A5N5Q8I2_9AGAM|nr:hypothetical protein CTheo_8841 [Ceratobasidium theobromae]
MAAVDGLFESDIVTLNAQGELHADFSSTFASASQDEDRCETLELMEFFHPVRGYGRSESESMNNGSRAAVMMDASQALHSQTERYVYVDDNDTTSQDEFRYQDVVSPPQRWNVRTTSMRQAEKTLGHFKFGPLPQTLTKGLSTSSFSTGVFTNGELSFPKRREDSNIEKSQIAAFGNSLKKTSSLVAKGWKAMQEMSVESFHSWEINPAGNDAMSEEMSLDTEEAKARGLLESPQRASTPIGQDEGSGAAGSTRKGTEEWDITKTGKDEGASRPPTPGSSPMYSSNAPPPAQIPRKSPQDDEGNTSRRSSRIASRKN